MFDANVDLIGPGGSTGEVAAQRSLNIYQMKPYQLYNKKKKRWESFITVFDNGKPKAMPLQTNATLRRDEWKSLDEAVMGVARDRLIGINDLVSRGLTYQLGNPMGTTVLEWHDVNDPAEATLTMDGITRGKNDRPKFQHNYLPIPIIHVDYEINSRELETSRRMGNGIDTYMAESAARRVAEKLEDMLFTDTDYAFGATDSRSRNKIYSYVNFPDRNTQTITAWDSSAKTSAGILTDVLNGIKLSISKKHYGPWTLYIPTDYQTVLDEDYDSTTPGTTVRERIMKLEGIEAIKTADHLPDDTVLLVEMKANNVRLVQGFGLQNVEWQTEGRFMTKYKVLTIQVPQIRSDQDGNSGIVHMSV